ncbi:MAG: hypothetical protein ABR909_04940 [Candidatus Bathyarchaeia archaeon]|jgi:hypothetical protein
MPRKDKKLNASDQKKHREKVKAEKAALEATLDALTENSKNVRDKILEIAKNE